MSRGRGRRIKAVELLGLDVSKSLKYQEKL